MRLARLVFLFAFAGLFAAAGYSSEGIEAVVKMQKEGVSEGVLLTFVQTSNVAYDPTADEIQQLEDARVPATVIVAMIDKGKEGKGETAVTTTTTVPAADNPATTTTTTTETTVVAPAAENQNISFFYESMAPYGEWVSVENYGWAWRPSIVNLEADWRPYAHGGHWVWTDYGWYWESTYPWGWAAFHYGRWNYDDRNHWVWIPDTTWGPSWVTWRMSDSHYGWAPLPPGSSFEVGVGFSFHNKRVGAELDFGLSERDFTFVPATAFLEVDIGRRVLPRAQVTAVFNQTTVVKNTYVSNDRRVINNGIPTQQVAARTGKQPEQVKVADANVAAGQPIKGETRSGNTIAAYRPKLNNTAPQDPPTVMKKHREAAQANNAQNRANAAQGNPAQKPPRAAATPAPGGQPSTTSERDAQRRLMEEKNTRRNAANKAAPNAPAGDAQRNAEEKRSAAQENAQQRQNQAETERTARQKAADEKRDAARENVQQKQSEAEAQRNAQQKAAEEKRDAARENLQQKQAQAEARRNTQQRAAEEKRDATRENVQQKQNEAQAQREAQQKAAEEKRDATRENIQQRQNPAEAQRKAAEEKGNATREQQNLNDQNAERDAQRRLQAEKEKASQREPAQTPPSRVEPKEKEREPTPKVNL